MAATPGSYATARIVSVRSETSDVTTLTLGDVDPVFLTGEFGQFAMVTVPAFPPVPISISRFGRDTIDLTIRAAGPATAAIIGLGPRAKSIMEDQLTWRRAESSRLSGLLDTMTKNRVVLVAEAAHDARTAADQPDGERALAESDLTAAYGDPPVGVRCGVPDPTGLTASSTLVTVEGIDWLPEELTGGWRMTSVGRIANVEITVPTEQGPAPSVASDLAPTITGTLPEAG